MMRTGFKVAFIALGLSIGLSTSAWAQDPGDCDRLAANPADPQRRAPGIAWEALNGKAAAKACQGAIAAVPNDPHFLYQYARALDKAGKLSEALPYYREAAASGYAMANFTLGNLLRTGEGTKQDKAAALTAYRAAADQGLLQAQFAAGEMLAKGEGIAQADVKQAQDYLMKAAQQGYGKAQAFLGMMYLTGSAGKDKISEGRDWLYKAADQGVAAAQAELGNLYAEGTILPRDLNLAEVWYKKAADQGNGDGMLGLAFLYWSDPGKKREGEAAKLFTDAALQGKAPAMATLVLIYQYGQGVQASGPEAFAWATLYAEYDKEGGKVRDKLAAQLSPDDRQKGTSRANELRQMMTVKPGGQ